MTDLGCVSNLRHARNVSITALHALEKAFEGCPDKPASEGVEACPQNIQKTISGIENELSRCSSMVLVMREG